MELLLMTGAAGSGEATGWEEQEGTGQADRIGEGRATVRHRGSISAHCSKRSDESTTTVRLFRGLSAISSLRASPGAPTRHTAPAVLCELV